MIDKQSDDNRIFISFGIKLGNSEAFYGVVAALLVEFWSLGTRPWHELMIQWAFEHRKVYLV